MIDQEIERLRDEIAVILTNPLAYKGWTVQGLGMLRLFLTPDKKRRLHIWHSHLKVSDVSTKHTHPWDLSSVVVSGKLINHRYDEFEDVVNPSHNRVLIRCGMDGCTLEPPTPVGLLPHPAEIYEVGQTYSQLAREIHDTGYVDGTVTVCDREYDFTQEERAYVYYGLNNEWGSARPREAKPWEILTYCGQALKQMEKS